MLIVTKSKNMMQLSILEVTKCVDAQNLKFLFSITTIRVEQGTNRTTSKGIRLKQTD